MSKLSGGLMALLDIGARFPAVTLSDIDGEAIEFPAVLTKAPASIVFFYRGQW
jgi:peroxiredoxin